MHLIPRQVIFGNPERAFAQISPDGRRIASLAPVGGVMNIVVAPIDAPAASRPLTALTGRGIGHCAWGPDGTAMLYLADADGDENWHLYRVALADGDTLDLTPGAGVRARLLETSPRYPREVLVEIQSESATDAGFYRIDLGTGRRQPLPAIAPFQRLLTDDFRPVLGMRQREDGGSEWFRLSGSDWLENWQPALSVAAVDNLTTHPIGLGPAGTLYLLDSRERDTAALCSLVLAGGEHRVLYADPQADVSDVLLDVRSGQPLAVAVTRQRKSWRALDAGVAAEFDYLQGRAHGDVSIASRSADDRHWLVGYQSDTAPVRYYHYDRGRGTAAYLFNNSERLAAQPLRPMQTATVTARDGLALPVFFTRPENGAAPAHATVLLVHGGPWARDEWGFQPWHQWLADRGYTVLSVNFRGSTGYGKAFLNAGDREWGRAMQEDLHDCVDWAVTRGLSDSDRVAIMGTSYGGYAALAGLAFTPARFACGIDLMGPAHLLSLLQAIPPQWQAQRDFFRQRVGDPDTAAGRELLAARSPLNRAGDICRPLLVAQGAHDPRVPRAESDRLVAALQSRGIPVIYLLFPDEGHGLARPANRLALCAIAEAFLARSLGGRVEPPGVDLDDSALQILAGAELLPDNIRNRPGH